jgi:hypothetical protein
MSQLDQIASVIQGEAITLEGQFAVASTIYNRMQYNLTNPGTFPGGTTAFGIATAGANTPSVQFEGAARSATASLFHHDGDFKWQNSDL